MQRRKRGKSVLRCPHCGSAELTVVGGQILGQVYHCQKCDYVGSLVFETDAPPEQVDRPGD